MIVIRRILFPVDFSMVSEHAIGNCIPKFFSTGVAEELVLIHVIDTTALPNIMDEYRKEVREKLENVAKEFRDMGINVVKTLVRLGTPAIEIAKAADEENVDLIYMPSKGENLLRHMIIGTTASNVARVARKPVLLVKYEWDKAKKSVKCFWDARRVFEKPLIALGLGTCSGHIIDTVKALFEDYIKEATLLHVVDYGKHDEVEKNVEKAMEQLKCLAKQFKFECDIEVSAGIASEEIIQEAVVRGATLIVIGKKSKSRLKELLMGSTAETVVRNSVLPVLLVPCTH